MLSSAIILTLAVSAIAAPASGINLDKYKREDGGFRIPVKKKNLGPVLERRSPYASTNDRWWLTLGIGSPPQDLNFLPDTAANGFSVQSTLIPKNQRGNGFLYDPSKSSSAKQQQGCTFSETFDSGYSDSGVCYTEKITVGDTLFNDVPISVETQVSSPNNYGRAGNLGLNTNPNGQSTSPKGLPTFMQAIALALPNYIMTMYYNTYTNTGELDFGFIDSSKYTGAIQYLTNRDSINWVVTFAGMYSSSGKYYGSNFNATIDSGTSGGSLPRNVLDGYFAQVPSATFDTNQNTYTFPCGTQLPDMIFAAGFYALHVPPISFTGGPLGSTGRCPCIFTVGDGFLGEAFIEGLFLVFDYANQKVGFANRPNTTSTITAPTWNSNVFFSTDKNTLGNSTTYTASSTVCYSLAGTQFFNKVGSFDTTRGTCSIYKDQGCTQPITGVTNQKFYLDGPLNPAGSFMCLWPIDYPAYNNGFMQVCTSPNFAGGCTSITWNSYVCRTLPTAYQNKVKSAGPGAGYCTFYTDNSCTKPIQNSAPMAYPGEANTPWGNQTQSFMCT